MTMSDKVFLDIVNMSITGSFAILYWHGCC